MIRLLNDIDQQNLKKWSYSVQDRSITTRILSPWWNLIVQYIPDYVAPNTLSLSGLVMIVFSYHITYLYAHLFPKLVALSSALLIFGYQTVDAIDGKHARITKNSSPLGELFDHACDSIGTIFIILTVAHHLGVTDADTLFYLTQGGLFLFLMEHLQAFRTRTVNFSEYTGPGEIIMGCITILLYKGVTGWSLIPWSLIDPKWVHNAIILLYWVCYIYSFALIWYPYIFPYTSGTVDINEIPKNDHFGTYFGLSACLSMRLFNGVLLYFGMIGDWTLQDVIAHALVLSVIISDMIVAKMANREFHSIVVVGSMLTMFNHDLFTFALAGSYFFRIFYEICQSQRLFLFTPAKNVYICGVFDLTHFGHMRHFVKAAELGNRLIVGVCSDEAVESYKRKPTMTMTERTTTVGLCGIVSEVISDAPLVTTKEFIEKHNIHVVGCSSEYDDESDIYYSDPRKMGILKVIPRVEGVSTSDIRKRVAEDVKRDSKKTQ